jgi:outer membrane protein assembly factor BamB
MKKALATIMGILLLSLVLGLTLNVRIVQSAGDWWPMFHHDLARIGYSTSTAPTTNQTLWSYTTGASVGSSPAVVDGVVYVGSDDHKVYALNVADGAFIWSYTTGEAVESSPAVIDGVVYVGSNDNKTYALNAATGALIWNYTTGSYPFYSTYALSSPAIVDGKVYVGSMDRNVYCLNAANGALIWNYTTYNSVTSSPAVADGRVYVGSWDASVYCLNASTGARIWQYADVGILSSPAVADGTVYIGQGGSYPRTRILALDAATGASIWNYTTGSTVVSSPAVSDGKVYVGSLDSNIYCVDATSGALIWSYKAGYAVYSSPTVAEGKLYVGSDDNKVYAFSSLPTPTFPTFTLAANTTAVITGGFFKLTGTLSIPKTSPPNITLQWAKDGSGFIYQQTFDTITNGVYIRDIAFTETGTYQFRVVWPGDATSNSATSNVVTVTAAQPTPTPTPTPPSTPAIPELPVTAILLLLAGSTAFSVILAKKKLKRSIHN